MGGSLILGQIIATLAQTQRGGGQAGQDPFGTLLQQQDGGLVRGQVLGAKVVEILSGDRAVLELAGNRYVVEGSGQLKVGQALTVRVSETGTRLVLDLVAERTPAEQNLASALRSIFSGADSAKSMENLSRQVAQLLETPEIRLPQETLQRLALQLAPVQVGEDTSRLAEKLQTMVKDLGLGLEAFLSKGGGKAEAQSAEGLKGLLARLVAAVADRGAEAPRAGATLLILLADFTSRLVQSLRSLGERDTAQLNARVEQAIANASRAAADSGGRLALEFASLRAELLTLAKDLPAREAANFERALDEMLSQLERRFTAELVREDAGKTAADLKERIETLQLLNVHLRDRGLYQHLFIPVNILGEMTEMQIKQFLSEKGKGGTGGSLTAVLLLDLESLGRLRIDALLQRRTLYVNVATEREEVAALAEEMRGDFATQLEARGLTLARLRASVDGRRIDDFHRFDAEILAGGEGIVDLQV